jgi:putative SOS response-associated peptidase YedK
VCGRYYRKGDKQAIAEHVRSGLADDTPLPPGYNIAPTTTQAVVRQSREGQARELVAMRWGLVGFHSNGPDFKLATFNARVENLSKSGLWRDPLRKRRCIVPLSGFYEFRKIPDRKKGDPLPAFRFSLRGQEHYALAGLWDAWRRPEGDWLQSFSHSS